MAKKRAPAVTLRAVMMELQGHDVDTISAFTNLTPAQVKSTLACPEADNIRREIQRRVIDTTAEIQTDIQTIAPAILQEKINLAFNARSETVRARAQQELLELAGHVPVKQVAIRREQPIDEDYRDKTEDEIRENILADLFGSSGQVTGPSTVH